MTCENQRAESIVKETFSSYIFERFSLPSSGHCELAVVSLLSCRSSKGADTFTPEPRRDFASILFGSTARRATEEDSNIASHFFADETHEQEAEAESNDTRSFSVQRHASTTETSASASCR